jgi:hypothetical protein
VAALTAPGALASEGADVSGCEQAESATAPTEMAMAPRTMRMAGTKSKERT